MQTDGAVAEYFGTDLGQVLTRWWTDTFAAVVDDKFPGAALALVVLRSDTTHDWRDPTAASSVLVEIRHGAGDTDPFVANVTHKLRFTVRTGLDSSHAQRCSDLIEPGDFPFGGAVSHRGHLAGVSGLTEESDAWVAQQAVDHLVAVRRDIADAAVAATLRHAPDWDYLPDRTPPPLD